jgi:Sec-independent protein translocase protein TatA
MFDFGFYEWVVIAVLGIIFIKPADYGRLIRNIARFIKKCDTIFKSILNQIDFYDK